MSSSIVPVSCLFLESPGGSDLLDVGGGQKAATTLDGGQLASFDCEVC